MGIVTDRDLVVRHLAQGASPDRPVRDVMTAGAALAAVGPELELLAAAEVLGRRRGQRLLVVAGGRVVGILSAGDVARARRAAAGALLTTSTPGA